ncbi:hypothetical protein [Bradyrhizobium ottawaense]|uniref:hypothetical protein n=1 Tax=Bradyrhizobium ottawaense TaxID=931866 RepID=UPI0030F45A18
MMYITELDINVLVALAAMFCALTALLSIRLARFRRRTIQLATANELLKEHFAALRKVVEHPTAPEKFKERLLIFSEVISDEKAFADLVHHVVQNDLNRDSEASGYSKGLAQLRAQDADLADSFASAVRSGVGAMMLRHPSIAEILEATMAKVYAAPRREGAVFAGAMRKNRADHRADAHLAVAHA